MRNLVFIASAAVLFAAATFLSTVPVGAATPATFTLTAGALSISAPTAGGTTTWTASAISTAFTPPAGPADPASNVSYGSGTITVSATVVATEVDETNLTGLSTVVTGASTGISTASWNPTISVVVPANYAPGVYSATVTHSVA
jgi:hypothetical protein